MSINAVNNATSGLSNINSVKENASSKTTANSVSEQTQQATQKTDGFAKTAYTKTDETDKFKSKSVLTKENAETIERLQKQTEQSMKKLMESVKSLVEKQGGRFTELADVVNLKYVDSDVIEKAKASLEGDGEFSVKTVSNNILDMAKALANGDSSNLSKLRDAFKEGFKQAEAAFGGKLPDISYQTYDAVMKGFDELEDKDTKDAEQAVVTE